MGARQWRNTEHVLESWSRHAGTLIDLYPGVQALNFIDADWRIRVVEPAVTNLAALDKSLRGNPNPSVIGALSRAEKSGELTRSDIINLIQGGSGFTLYQQIDSTTGETLGFANGVFRVSDLMHTCLADERLSRNFQWALLETSGETFFRSPSNTSLQSLSPQTRVTVDIADHPWSLVFAPTDFYLDSNNSSGLVMLAVLGVLLAGLLAYVFDSC